MMAGNVCKCCGQIVYPKAQEVAGEKWRMLMGDCLHVMRSMPDKSVDAIITDPPYGSGGMTANYRLRTSKDKYVSTGSSYASTLPDIDGMIAAAARDELLVPAVWRSRYRDGLHDLADRHGLYVLLEPSSYATELSVADLIVRVDEAGAQILSVDEAARLTPVIDWDYYLTAVGRAVELTDGEIAPDDLWTAWSTQREWIVLCRSGWASKTRREND